MDCPCYNKLTKTSCPDRIEGCAVTCPKWAAYVKERDKNYIDRARAKKEQGIMFTKGHVKRIHLKQR